MTTELTPKETQETLSSDINVLAAEINTYKRIAGEAIFEIGRRLKRVRDARTDSPDADERRLAEQREAAGGWIKWLAEHVDFDRRQASNFITVYETLPSDVCTYTHLGFRALYEIATLPPEARDREYTLKSGETKRPEEMTVRQIRELKAALRAQEQARKEAEARAKKAEEECGMLRDTLESVRDQPPRVEYIRDDEAEERLRRYEARFGDIGTYESAAYRIPNATDISAAIQTFSFEARKLLKNYAYLTQFQREFSVIPEVVADDFSGTIEALEKFVGDLKYAVSTQRGDAYVININ